MNLLVTAGNTIVLIDKVRCLTNIFTGRTGTRIALLAHKGGHAVTLLTSHPEVVEQLCGKAPPADHFAVHSYQTFDDLQRLMEQAFQLGDLNAVVHCAAISDYRAAGVYAASSGTYFEPEYRAWHSNNPALPRMEDRSAGKVKSDEPELWLRLLRTPKLVDRIRTDWHFRGILVKFKLEVGLSDEQLLNIAERSRRHSDADLMVANTLEGAPEWAFLGPLEGRYRRVTRDELAPALLTEVERLIQERAHG